MLDRMLDGLRNHRSVDHVSVFENDGYVLSSHGDEASRPISEEVKAWLELIETSASSQLITLVHQHGDVLLRRISIGILLIRTSKDINLGSIRRLVEEVALELSTGTP